MHYGGERGWKTVFYRKCGGVFISERQELHSGFKKEDIR